MAKKDSKKDYKKKYIFKEIYVCSDLENGVVSLYDRADNSKVDLLSFIHDVINLSATEKAEVKIFIDGLSIIRLSLVNYCFKLGYSIIPVQAKKKMRVGDVRYCASQNHLFYYQLKTGARSFVTFQNVECVVGRRGDLMSKEDANTDFDIFYRIKEMYTQGLRYPESRLLFAISTISRSLYNRKFNFYGGPWWQQKTINGQKANVFLEEYCRPNYHGGYSYISEKSLKYNGRVTVVDCNSIYPFVTHDYMPLPKIVDIGDGATPKNYRNKYFYSVSKCRVTAELKPGKKACIYKDGTSGLNTNNIIEHCKNLKITMNTYDTELLYRNYNVQKIEYLSHITFAVTKHMFANYIDPLYKKKSETKGAERSAYKLLINGLLGTFAKKPYKDIYTLEVRDDGVVEFKRVGVSKEQYERNLNNVSGYVYLAAAITSAARLYMQKFIDMVDDDKYLYTDTDSIHIAGDLIPKGIPISNKMGEFKVEHRFSKVAYRGIKEYMYIENGQVNYTMAGFSSLSVEFMDRLGADCPGWIKAGNKHFKQCKHKIDYAIKHGRLNQLFEICVPHITVTDSLDAGLYLKVVWRPVLSFEKIKRNVRGVLITLKPIDISILKQKDKERNELWDKRHKNIQPLSIEDWLLSISKKEKDLSETKKEKTKQMRARKRSYSDFVSIDDLGITTPFDDINEA